MFLIVAFSDKTQYKYFFRTIPTQVIAADVMLAFAASQGWSKVGVLYTNDPLGQQCKTMAMVTQTKGFHCSQLVSSTSLSACYYSGWIHEYASYTIPGILTRRSQQRCLQHTLQCYHRRCTDIFSGGYRRLTDIALVASCRIGLHDRRLCLVTDGKLFARSITSSRCTKRKLV